MRHPSARCFESALRRHQARPGVHPRRAPSRPRRRPRRSAETLPAGTRTLRVLLAHRGSAPGGTGLYDGVVREADLLRCEPGPGQERRPGQARIDHQAPVTVRAAALRRRGRAASNLLGPRDRPPARGGRGGAGDPPACALCGPTAVATALLSACDSRAVTGNAVAGALVTAPNLNRPGGTFPDGTASTAIASPLHTGCIAHPHAYFLLSQPETNVRTRPRPDNAHRHVADPLAGRGARYDAATTTGCSAPRARA